MNCKSGTVLDCWFRKEERNDKSDQIHVIYTPCTSGNLELWKTVQ